MATELNQLVFKQPLWKRVVQVFSGILFIAMGAFLMYVESDKADLFIRIIGFLCILFGIFGIFFSFKKSLVVLIANTSGLIPVFVVGQRMTLIPWKNVKQFAKVSQKVRMNTFGYLAVYLNEPQELLDPVDQFSQQIGKNSLSDGGVADMYIPAFNFSTPLDDVIRKLDALKSASLNQAV